MLNKVDAKRLGAQKVGATEDGPNSILDHATIEKPWGWVFFYESRRFLENRDQSHRLVGNSPIIVNRMTGGIFETGTAHSIQFYLQNFEATGDPHKRLGRQFEIRPRNGTRNSVGAARILAKGTLIGVGQAKRGLESSTASTPMLASASSPAKAAELCDQIRKLGYDCIQIPEPAH